MFQVYYTVVEDETWYINPREEHLKCRAYEVTRSTSKRGEVANQGGESDEHYAKERTSDESCHENAQEKSISYGACEREETNQLTWL